MNQEIVFQWTQPNFLSVYIKTTSQLFETQKDQQLVAKIYEDRRFLTFWKYGKLTSRKIRKRQSIIEATFKHVPEVRKLVRSGVLGDMETVDAKTIAIKVERPLSKLEQVFLEAGKKHQ